MWRPPVLKFIHTVHLISENKTGRSSMTWGLWVQATHYVRETRCHVKSTLPSLPHAVTCIRNTSPRLHTSNAARWKSNAAFLRQKRAVGNCTERRIGTCVIVIMLLIVTISNTNNNDWYSTWIGRVLVIYSEKTEFESRKARQAEAPKLAFLQIANSNIILNPCLRIDITGIQALVRKLEGKRSLWRSRHRGDNNIKVDLKKIG